MIKPYAMELWPYWENETYGQAHKILLLIAHAQSGVLLPYTQKYICMHIWTENMGFYSQFWGLLDDAYKIYAELQF